MEILEMKNVVSERKKYLMELIADKTLQKKR